MNQLFCLRKNYLIMNKYFFVSCFALVLGATHVHAQDKVLSNSAYCKCIEDYSYNKHIDEYYTSGFKCFRAWKKDMKRKKKECQAKALEQDFPMAARRKRREAERKIIKRDKLNVDHKDIGKSHEYWY